jgi:glyoxylase-like metal-dependent hydrolase (beta-lactamase superfamily II)
MHLNAHYCSQGFGNCYMLGADTEIVQGAVRDVIIIDPCIMDEKILNFIEQDHYNLRGILITHNHLNHTRGLHSLMRIYSPDVYAAQQYIFEYKTTMVRDGDVFNIGRFQIEVISVPGHSADSVVYKIKHLLFTGDALSAGMMGATPSPYGAMHQISTIQNRIFSLQGNYVVLPGHGPPSTLNVERENNVALGHFLDNRRKSERSKLGLDLLE